MDDNTTTGPSRRNRRIGWGVGLLAAGALAGGVAATALPALADPGGTPSASSSSGTTDRRGAPDRQGGQRPDEKVLTGTDAEKARAAAVKALPGATVDRVETDADGAVYEAHVTGADGTKATVRLDKDFTVTSAEEGMGGHR